MPRNKPGNPGGDEAVRLFIKKVTKPPLPDPLPDTNALRERYEKGWGGTVSPQHQHSSSDEEKGKTMSKPIRYLLALVVILAMAAASILVNKYGLEHSIGAHKQIKELDAGKTSEASPAKEKVGTATQAPSTPATIAASSKVDKQLPIVQMYPCSDGSPAGLQQEGFANPLRITGGFEAYTGCRIVHVDSVHEDMQFLIGMRVEHPYTGQSCKDGHKCLALWKDVRFGSYPEEGKLLRIVNPSGAWFITRPTP